jgi:chaperone modulatory protein CbpM
MIGEHELIAAIGPLDADALQRWIDLGWVLPEHDPTPATTPAMGQRGDTLRFDDFDVARVRLICELHYELHIEEDSLSVVLSLLDQLYAARRSLRTLVAAVEAQPEDVRARIASLVKTEH